MTCQDLIAEVLDGEPDEATVAALARALETDPEVRRRWSQHLIISEMVSQALAPERDAQAFMDGLVQRHRAMQDGAEFTAQVMARVKRERLQRAREVGSFAFEVVGISAAAALLIGLFATAVQALSNTIPTLPRIAPPSADHEYRAIDGIAMLGGRESSRE